MMERAACTEFIGKRIYVDTNILIYFVQGIEKYEIILISLFEMARQGSVQLATSELTLLEVLVGAHVAREPRAREIYRSLLEDSGWIELVPVSRDVLIQAATVRGEHRLSIPDAIHLATAASSGCDVLLTNDKDMCVAAALKVAILNDWVG